jgi:hypothetical protein
MLEVRRRERPEVNSGFEEPLTLSRRERGLIGVDVGGTPT